MEMMDNLPPPSEYQLPSEATQDVLMITEAQDGNSPTPKVDIPLAPPNLDSNKPILDMLTMIQKQLEHSETRLAALENPPVQPSWDAMMADPRNDDSFLHGTVADIDYMHPTPEQLDLLQQKEELEYAEYYASLNTQEQQRIDEEEQHAQSWKLIMPDERADATLAAGGLEEQAALQRSTPTYINPLTGPPTGTAANPIPVLSTQSSGPAVNTAPSHVPISHLVPNHGRNPIPGLVWRPNPQQQNALPTIGGSSYTSTAARRPQRNDPTLTRPSTAPTTTPPPPALTETQLRARSTTKAAIVQHARDTFNARLSITKTKAELIQLYLNLVANRGMPTNPTMAAPTTNQTPSTSQPRPRKITSDWNICRLPGTETIEFTKPFGGNAYSMVKAIESSL